MLNLFQKHKDQVKFCPVRNGNKNHFNQYSVNLLKWSKYLKNSQIEHMELDH